MVTLCTIWNKIEIIFYCQVVGIYRVTTIKDILILHQVVHGISNLHGSKIHSNSHLLSLRHLLEEGVAARQHDGEAGLLELAPQRLPSAALPVLLDLALQQSKCCFRISLHI